MRNVRETIAITPIKVSEKVFMGQVVQYLRTVGWKVYHPWLSIKSAAGFPDLVCARAGRCCFIELKTEAGKISAAQAEWGEALAGVGGTVEYHLLRPTDQGWAFIEQTFR